MILLTGATGFVGSYLAERLVQLGAEVCCVRRRRSRMDNVSHIADRLRWVECDLLDPAAVYKTISEVAPEKIFHLAAQTHVPTSFKQPYETMNTNITATLNILEAVRNSHVDPVILYTSSSEVYGLVYPEEVPVKETNPLRPLSPYGVSKAACDLLCQQYHRSYGLKIVVTRAFNHEGPRRPEDFAPSWFAKQIAEAELGVRGEIRVGNLEAVRDYTDVRDVVEAYLKAVEKCRYGTPYNICSGKGWRIGEVLNYLVKYSGVNVKIVQDKSLLRPSDVPILVGDSSKFRSATGWMPRIRFEKTLEDILNWWRDRLRRSS